MKRILALFLAVLTIAGCGRLKVDDPAERAALRTRDASCPIESVFSAQGLKTTLSIAGRIKPGRLLDDYKQARTVCEQTKPLAKAKEAFAKVKEEKAGEYSPGLTLYSTIMFLAFIVIVLAKTGLAIFKND